MATPGFQTEDLYFFDEPTLPFRVTASVFYAIVAFMALLGNIFVMLRIWLKRSLHRPTYYFVASLSLADLLTGTVALPIGAYGRVSHTALTCSDASHIWFFILAYYLHCVSIIHLIAIAFDRYLCIAKPLHYVNLVTPKRTTGIVALIWVASIPFGLMPWYGGNDSTNQSSPCFTSSVNLLMNYAPATLIPVCLCTLSVVYWIIFRVARRQALRISALERAAVHGAMVKPIQLGSQMKATRTTLLVLCVFAVCWLPVSIKFFFVVHLNTTPTTMLYLRTAFEIVGYCNAALNPFVYFCMDRNFRNAKRPRERASVISLKIP